MKILIVDDEHDILEFLSYNIKKEGYDLVTADNGKRGYYLAKKHIPNLIILDVMMPQMDGFEVCKKIREKDELKKSKIIFLSAKSDEETIEKAYKLGAIDFVNKPIKPKLLISRIKSVLYENTDEKFKVGNIELNHELKSIYVDDIKYSLKNDEFILLKILILKPGQVFSVDYLINKTLLGLSNTNELYSLVQRIREKIGRNYIKTIKGIGYKFEI